MGWALALEDAWGGFEPAAAQDELVAEVPDVSYRAAEAGNAQPEENEQNFEGRTCRPVFGLGRVPVDRHSDVPDRLGVVEERHKTEIHVQFLMTMEQRQPGLSATKSDFTPSITTSFDHPAVG